MNLLMAGLNHLNVIFAVGIALICPALARGEDGDSAPTPSISNSESDSPSVNDWSDTFETGPSTSQKKSGRIEFKNGDSSLSVDGNDNIRLRRGAEERNSYDTPVSSMRLKPRGSSVRLSREGIEVFGTEAERAKKTKR